MNLTKINSALTNTIKPKQLSSAEFQLTTSILYPNNQPIILFVQKINNSWILTDKKQTLKQMNSIYDLNSKDTIKAMRKIITAYDFQMKSGILITEINEIDLSQKILEFLICIGHLMNMYVFFDEPD